MIRKTKEKTENKCGSDECELEIHRPSRRGTRLELPVGGPDLEALRSVTREWLVPLLVERFLREQGVELRACSKSDPGKTNSQTIGRGGRSAH